jgi:membrane peptidoglycan carboxypeptidase
MRGSAAGDGRARRGAQAEDDFWENSGRAGAAGGYRGTRRAGTGAGSYGENGGSRTALRDEPDFWPGDQTGRTSLRTRVTDRTGLGRGTGGGRGNGSGGPGSGRNGWDRGRSRGKGFKNWLLYGNWWRHWTWKKVLAVLGGAFAAFILLCIGAFFLMYSMTKIPTAETEAASWQSSNVYLGNGQLLGTFSNGGQTRELLTAGEVPKVMTEAMTAAEDRNFYHEGGISVTGLLRAAYDDVFHGGNQGASTITMQYAKNAYAGVNTGQNISTELKEVFIAMKLAHVETKQWVMTSYLNTVPFGGETYGLAAAAENYFNVDLAKKGATLSVSQAAMLAAMPNAPGFFDPVKGSGIGYTKLVQRWKYVLGNMVKDGNITRQQANAQKFPKITPGTIGTPTGVKGYLYDMVEQELTAPRSFGGYGLTPHQLDTGGYKITTTFQLGKIRQLSRSVKWGTGEIKALSGTSMPGYDWIGSVLEDVKTGAIIAIDGGPGLPGTEKQYKACVRTDVSCYQNRAEEPEEVGSSFKPYVLATAVSEGMSVFSSKLMGYEPLAIPYAAEGSSPSQSQIALMKSSVFKGPGGQSLAQDNQVIFYNGVVYKVFNEPGENYGRPLPVNEATALSSDAAFEDLAHRAGINSIIAMARKLGVGQNPFNQNCVFRGAVTVADMKGCSDLYGPNGLYANFSTNSKLCKKDTCGSPQITYGESPLTPIEQASTFATFADGGMYHSPHVIASVVHDGKKLKSDVLHHQVLNSAQAADVDWALSFDNNYSGGTANGSVSFRRGGIIAKTGTLGTGASANTAWFVGATPRQYSLSVALYTEAGNGTSETLNNLPATGGQTGGEFGGAWPASIWNNYMFAIDGSGPYQAVDQYFPRVYQGFVPWIQVTQIKHKAKACQFGFLQRKNCQCPGQNGNGNGHQCGNQPPGHCPPLDPTCSNNGGSPSPTVSPSPSPTPSPSPSPSGQPSGGATQAAAEEAVAAVRLGLPGG